MKICRHGLVRAGQHLLRPRGPGPWPRPGPGPGPRPSAGPAIWPRGPSSDREITKTTMAVAPEIRNWLVIRRGCRSGKWSRVWLATMLVIRLPATGPTVQKPMAEARPNWGLKSRTMAGVATRMAPSTSPMARDDDGELPLGVGGGNPEEDQQADDQQAVDDDVGPAQLVGLAGRQGGEGAEQVGDDDDPHVERERHVERTAGCWG